MEKNRRSPTSRDHGKSGGCSVSGNESVEAEFHDTRTQGKKGHSWSGGQGGL